MKKDNKVISLPAGQKIPAPIRTPVDKVANDLYQDMLAGYEKYRLGTKRNTKKTVSSDLNVIKGGAPSFGQAVCISLVCYTPAAGCP